MIELLTADTPNGKKISIMLEEIGYEYKVTKIHIPEQNQTTNMNSMATVSGKINAVMIDHKMLNISRGPIEKWDRPAATLDFMVNDDIDLSLLKVDMAIEFTFEINNGEFIITELSLKEIGQDAQEEVQIDKPNSTEHSGH